MDESCQNRNFLVDFAVFGGDGGIHAALQTCSTASDLSPKNKDFSRFRRLDLSEPVPVNPTPICSRRFNSTGRLVRRATNKLSVKFVERNDLKPGLYGDGSGLYLQVSAQKPRPGCFGS